MTQGTTGKRKGYALLCGLILVLVRDVGAQAGGAYPEQRRFDAAEFHEGLRKRGLTKLLALHLKEHPPADEIEAVLLNRDTKLAEYAVAPVANCVVLPDGFDEQG